MKSVEIKLFFYFQLNVLHIFERMRNQRQGALNLVLFPLIMLKLASWRLLKLLERRYALALAEDD